MAISDATERFFGRPVDDFDKDEGLSDPQARSYRLALEYDDDYDTFDDKFSQVTADPNCKRLEALVIGSWGDSYENTSEVAINSLIKARDKLPALRALFIGDMTYEECEISWIRQSDISPLYGAFPNLEWLQIRGGDGLELGKMNLPRLRGLVIETGGLGVNVLKALERASLPELEHLELWLGTEDYGWDGTVADLEPLLQSRFPKLRYLGLRNCAEADALAPRLAASPVASMVEVLDLSLGNLSDEGGKALLKLPVNGRLKRLDLHHHYLSDDIMAQLARLPFEVNMDDKQEPDEWGDGKQHRYIAVSE